jgi:hypothetical protein
MLQKRTLYIAIRTLGAAQNTHTDCYSEHKHTCTDRLLAAGGAGYLRRTRVYKAFFVSYINRS